MNFSLKKSQQPDLPYHYKQLQEKVVISTFEVFQLIIFKIQYIYITHGVWTLLSLN